MLGAVAVERRWTWPSHNNRTSQSIWLPFPLAGAYQEMVVLPANSTVDGRIPVVKVGAADEWHQLTVPANMGFVYVK